MFNLPYITKKKLTDSKWLIFVILSVSVILPFSNDIYLPSLPEINQLFLTTHAALLVSIFLFGLAISQLFYGPLLDRYGRRPILLLGLSLYTLTSIAIVFANSIETLLALRFIQSIGACSATVSALSIVRDIYPEKETIRKVAFIMGIIAICPCISPALGGFLQIYWGWQASFIFLALLGLLYLSIILFLFPETAQNNQLQFSINTILQRYLQFFADRPYKLYILTSAFSYAALFSYLAVSPVLLMINNHVSVQSFGFILLLNAIPVIVMSYVSPKMIVLIEKNKLILMSFMLFVGSGLLMLLSTLMHSQVILLILAMLITSIGIGMIRPIASSCALNRFSSHTAGSAAAMFNFFSFIGAAFFSFIAGNFIKNMHIFAYLILLLGILGILTILPLCIKQLTAVEKAM